MKRIAQLQIIAESGMYNFTVQFHKFFWTITPIYCISFGVETRVQRNQEYEENKTCNRKIPTSCRDSSVQQAHRVTGIHDTKMSEVCVSVGWAESTRSAPHERKLCQIASVTYGVWLFSSNQQFIRRLFVPSHVSPLDCRREPMEKLSLHGHASQIHLAVECGL